MDIPYVDLAAQHAALEEEILEAVRRVLRHGQFILGDEVNRLEQILAERLGVEHVIGVSSGTAALVLTLRLHDIGPGDEVITVSHSFVATASAVRLVGATPVFVDIDDETMVLDPGHLNAAVSPKTKAVLPVHLNGFPCAIEEIAEFCDAHELILIEDCAQAIGATYGEQSVGTRGVGCFSLHPLKILSACGDAGFITTDDEKLADRLRTLRNLGLCDRNHVDTVSGNMRLDAMHAAILQVKIQHLDTFLKRRRAHAAAYRRELPSGLRLPPTSPDAGDVHSAYVIRHAERDAFVQAMRARGIDVKIHYPIAIHQQEPFADVRHTGLDVTERVVNEICSLPVSSELSVEQRNRVIEAAREVEQEL